MTQKNRDFEGFVSGHNACAGCGAAIAMRHILKVCGKNTIVTIATGCMEVVSTAYPFTAWRVPCIHSAFENAAATASGIEAALKKQGKKINVIAIAGDGGTFDIGLQALSGMLERGHRVLYICYDNEAYMNTGIQRSSSTPLHAATTTTPYGLIASGKLEQKKNMPFIVASHNHNVYVATASIGYLQDFKNKIKKALEHINKSNGGPAYIQVLCPCIPGWKIPSNMTIRLAKQAVNCRAYPLFEIEQGKIKLQEFPYEKLENYLKAQGRFSHLTSQEIEDLKKFFEKQYEKLKKIADSGLEIF